MNGYLMQEQAFVRGTDTFIESFSQENKHGVVFEDDGETGYFYAVERDAEGQGLRVLDALHIYEVEEAGPGEAAGGAEADPEAGKGKPGADRSAEAPSSKLQIVWSRDWEKCALVIDGFCHAIYDFIARGGYNINEFPPPNEIWTQGERKLSDELIRKLF
jgi:hypothetical protein